MLAALLLLSSVAWAVPALAVLDLENRTGDPTLDGAGPGVSAILVTKLSRVDTVQVVERERVRDVLDEIALSSSGAVDPSAAVRAGKLLGARYLVTGTLVSARLPTLAIAVRVVDTESGAVVLAEDVTGEIGARGEDFFVLVDELAFEVIGALDVALGGRDRIEVGQVDVRELDTVRLYGRALAALDAGKPEEAEALLSKALALEPGFRLAEEALQHLKIEVRTRRTSYAHAKVDEMHAKWDALEAAVRDRAAKPSPTAADMAAMAIRARLHVIRGEFAEALALEERRAAFTREHFDAIRGRGHDPDPDFQRAARELLAPHGFGRIGGQFHELRFYPHELAVQRGELLLALGRRDEAVALLVRAYQDPGPMRGTYGTPVYLAFNLERWRAWDTVVALAQQELRQHELAGHALQAEAAVRKVDDLITRLEAQRADRNRWEATATKLGKGAVSTALVREEMQALDGLFACPELRLAAYLAFAERVERGWYDPVERTADYESLVSRWRHIADSVWHEPWNVEQQLGHLLAAQAQAPARDAEAAAEQAADLEAFLEKEYHP